MGFAIITLTYIYILVIAYVFVIIKDNSERAGMLINKAYQYAFSVLLYSFLLIWILLEFPYVTLDEHTASYLILTSKFASVLTLGCSIFVLRKKLT